MTAVIDDMFVYPMQAGAFESRIADRPGLVNGMPGVIVNRALQPAREPASDSPLDLGVSAHG